MRRAQKDPIDASVRRTGVLDACFEVRKKSMQDASLLLVSNEHGDGRWDVLGPEMFLHEARHGVVCCTPDAISTARALADAEGQRQPVGAHEGSVCRAHIAHQHVQAALGQVRPVGRLERAHMDRRGRPAGGRILSVRHVQEGRGASWERQTYKRLG